MNKKKTLRTLLILSLIVLIVYFVIDLFIGKEPEDLVQEVSIDSVKKAAEKSLNSFEEWRGPALEERYTFYDLNNKPSAYLYNISDYYGKAGYVVISATTKFEPVIEVSNSEVTPVAKIIEIVNSVALGTMYEPSAIKSEYIYLGGTEYYARLTLREGGEADVRYYLISGDETREVKLAHMENKQQQYEEYKEEQADEKWQDVIGK